MSNQKEKEAAETLKLRGTERFRHPLDTILPAVNVHDGNTRNLSTRRNKTRKQLINFSNQQTDAQKQGCTYLSNPALEVLITRCHDVAAMLLASLNQTVIGIRTGMTARDSLKSRILRQAQCQSVLLPKLLQLRHHTVRDAGDALRQQTVHHGLVDLELVFDRKVDKVGIDQHMIRRAKLCVILEEHCGGRLVDVVLRFTFVFFDLTTLLDLSLLVLSAIFQ